MHVQAPTEAGRRRKIAWSQSYRHICAALCGCWDLNFHPYDQVAISLVVEISLQSQTCFVLTEFASFSHSFVRILKIS